MTKFNTHHFPIGTIFTVGLYPGEENREWTVTGIVRNGPMSFVLRTGEHQDMGGTAVEISYNVSHVTKIVKRGAGPVVIDGAGYDTINRLKHDIKMMAIPCNRKGSYSTGSIHTVVAYLAAKIDHQGQSIDLDRLADAVSRQSWCRPHPTCRWGVLVNKKRLHRFIQQNINRFCVNLKAWDREDQRLYMEDLEALDRQWERDWEDHDMFQNEASDYDSMLPDQACHHD